jgi:thrombospondin type 3 repeat protein
MGRTIERCAGAAALAAGLLLPVSFAGAETFDLHLYRYCQPGTFCGHASEQAYQQYICQAVEEMNLVWEPAGISFRPTVMPIDGTSPLDTTGLPPGKDKYYKNPGCKDDDSYDALRTHWRENVAEPDTAALAMMLNAPWNTCCSGIPRTFKNLEKAHGIYCDANPSRGALRNGQLWAHEMGHHWSLGHTHSGSADTADGQDPTSDADAGVPNACTDWDANGDAQGCGNDQDCVDLGLGTCSESDGLPPVSDTPADRGKFETCKLRCQNDPAATKASCTTDADCDQGEGPCACPGADEDSDANILDGHTWFASKSSVKDVTGVSTGISKGSPHPTWCDTEIKDQTGGMTVGSNTNPAIEVTMRDVMSYHGGDCLGPYVRFGNRREAFTEDQLARIAACRQQIYPRDAAHLPDVCANRGDDDDHDGRCDIDDNCPLARNTCQADLDGDGEGDACDLCPEDPTPTGDIDGDGIGDACDQDIDGDGCLNGADDHPQEGQLPLLTTVYVGCPNQTETSYVSDAADTDRDGVLNCEDPDDDGDGLCDAPGPGCEVVGDACPEVAGSICIKLAGGEPCPPIWFVCGQQCVEYLLKMTAVINPDPTRDLVFEHISMVNRAIFAEPLGGKTAAESVLAIAEKVMGGAGARAARSVAGPAREQVRLELWRRLREGDRLVAVVGEYDSDHLEVGELVQGGLLRLLPTLDLAGAPTLVAETTHGIGLAARVGRDRDGDGVPDLGDNCVAAANAAQTDVDGDGFGNACDADLDQDGVVDEGDVAGVEACEGADLAVGVPLLEPEAFDGETLGEPALEPGRVEAALASFCAVADLDGNGRVDPADSRLADGMRGGAPGPSALDRGVRPPPHVAPLACVDPIRVQSAIVRLAGLKRRPGSQSLSLEGTLALPQPFVAPDPVVQGVSLTVRDAAAEKLLDVRVPGGAFDGGTGVGWKPLLLGTGFRYVNPDGLMGITAVVVRWNTAGQVTVQVSGSGANLAPSGHPLPLLWQLNLDPDRTVTDRCGETDYSAASCQFRRRGAVLACR